MKILLLLSFSLLCTISVFSQDVIFTRSGDKIEAKVVEITSTTIKYKKFDQQDGPIRNIGKSEVKEIIYEDGQWDKFDEKEETIEKEKVEEKREEYRSQSSKDHLFEKGLFLDGMFCYNMAINNEIGFTDFYDQMGNYLYSEEYKLEETVNYFGFNVRIGNKWYFGASEKWRPGIQATWARVGIFMPEDITTTPPKFTLSLLNLGFANAFKFNENSGMELNANVGFSMNGIPVPYALNNNSNLQIGIVYGAEIKYRYKALAAGIDFSRFHLNSSNNRGSLMNVLALTFGFKM